MRQFAVLWMLQGFSNPSVFDPDRFGPGCKEDIKYQKNFLTFGHGPHYCVGKDYAVNQIICFLANLSTRSVLAQELLLACELVCLHCNVALCLKKKALLTRTQCCSLQCRKVLLERRCDAFNSASMIVGIFLANSDFEVSSQHRFFGVADLSDANLCHSSQQLVARLRVMFCSVLFCL